MGVDLEVGGDHHLSVRLGLDRQDADQAAHALTGVRHGDEAGVAAASEAELGLQIGQVAAALARALGVAGLGHEVGDDAVEFQPVIEALVSQGADAFSVTGRRHRRQFDQDPPLRRVDDQQILGRDGAPVRGGRLNLSLGLGQGRSLGRSRRQKSGGRRRDRTKTHCRTHPLFLTLSRTRAAMAGLTKLSIAPSRRAISLTRREAMA